jgi:hypothetical protein
MTVAAIRGCLGSIVWVTWSWEWLGHVGPGKKDGLKWQIGHYHVWLSVFVHFLFYFQQLNI